MTTEVPSHLVNVRLNDLIQADESLQHESLISNVDRAYEMAHIEKPYMEKALANIALGNQLHSKGLQNMSMLLRDLGVNVEPPLNGRISFQRSLFYGFRGVYRMKKAHKLIRTAYEASTHLA